MSLSALNAADILAAKTGTLFGANIAEGYRALARQWHPDLNKDPKATEVFAHLAKLKRFALEGHPEHFDIPNGKLTWTDTEIKLVSNSADGLNTGAIMSGLRMSGEALEKRLLPVLHADATTVRLQRPPGFVPMSRLLTHFNGNVPQFHVAWIASRLYELAGHLHQSGGGCCAGILPETLGVLVKEHGVLALDYRFFAVRGTPMQQIPASLLSFVPKDKRACAEIDLRSASRVALILLGDPSGIGNALLMRAKQHPELLNIDFLNWFRTPPGAEPISYYKEYRRMLEKCFGKPKYHNLELE